MVIGERIKKLREAKQLTREELAKHLNLSYWAIAKYETGERTPDTATVERLAEFFDVSVDYLLGRTDDPTPPVAWLGREDNDPLKDLPEEARQSVLDFIAYVKAKYQRKKEDEK